MQVDHLAAHPAFMYDMAQTILACSSVKEFGQRQILTWQELRNTIPLVRSLSNSNGRAGFKPCAFRVTGVICVDWIGFLDCGIWEIRMSNLC